MSPIPARIKRVLESMPRMRICEMVWFPEFGPCDGRIEWHHVWTVGSRQVQEVFAILGACTRHHEMVKKDPRVKRAFERRSLEVATDAELARYPKVDWGWVRRSLKLYEKHDAGRIKKDASDARD